jgi:DNA mismatch repair protein MutS2
MYEIRYPNFKTLRLFPSSAYTRLEFDKITSLLFEHCECEYAKEKAQELIIHTDKEFIETELKQSYEYKLLIQSGTYFPNDYVLNLSKELKLLAIPGAVLHGDQFIQLRKLAESIEKIFRWFDRERKTVYPGLVKIIEETHYEKAIIKMIDDVLDEQGQVKDTASDELRSIRMNLYKKRNELRRIFEKIISKLNKQGYLAEIEESFMNGRRVVAVFAEQKRMVKGILHSESDTRRTSFIEPEETIGLNNEIFSLENDERKEVYHILRELTNDLSQFEPLISSWHIIVGEYDFIRGKAKLAMDMRAEYPSIVDRSHIHLVQAYHPLLFLYNQKLNKPTIPVTLDLDEKNRILLISGPNAGGKTVAGARTFFFGIWNF